MKQVTGGHIAPYKCFGTPANPNADTASKTSTEVI
jgi:hypothetical protein